MYRFFSLKKGKNMTNNLLNTLPLPLKLAGKFIAHNESAAGLSTSRFIQDTTTQLIPKATFSRSKAELFENTFLETAESAVVYFLPQILGEKIFRKLFSKKLNLEQKKLIAKNFEKLKNNPNKNKVIPIKAAIAITSLIIPILVFTLNYFKNLLTIKAFKQSDFVNIASLEKKEEDNNKINKVKNSAYKNLTRALIAAIVSVLGAVFLAKKGSKSKKLRDICEFILSPGDKLAKNNKKLKEFVNKYFCIDYTSENGKLNLSKGQLTSCVLIGGLGYFGAAYDRGKENFMETLFRYPIVGLYVISGSELFENGFKRILKKSGRCKETLKDDLKVVKFSELNKLANKLADKNNTDIKNEYKKLVKQKSLITLIPFIFSIGVMGFFVCALTNISTKLRYKKEKAKQLVV